MNEAVLVVAVLTLPYNKSVLELCTIIALSQGSVPFPHWTIYMQAHIEKTYSELSLQMDYYEHYSRACNDSSDYVFFRACV